MVTWTKEDVGSPLQNARLALLHSESHDRLEALRIPGCLLVTRLLLVAASHLLELDGAAELELRAIAADAIVATGEDVYVAVRA